jgi:predicted small metal-binding protein
MKLLNCPHAGYDCEGVIRAESEEEVTVTPYHLTWRRNCLG